jgi:hypothetical protein
MRGYTRIGDKSDDGVEVDFVILEFDFDAAVVRVAEHGKNAGRGTKRVYNTRFVLTLKSRR